MIFDKKVKLVSLSQRKRERESEQMLLQKKKGFHNEEPR